MGKDEEILEEAFREKLLKLKKQGKKIGAIGADQVVKEVEKLDKIIPDGPDTTKERK